MRVVFVGAGNLATRLSLEMRKSGMSIGQVYSHTSEHAKILADELGCGWTVVPEDIVEDADLYVFSLKDAVLQDVIARVKPNNGLWVHTAGSMQSLYLKVLRLDMGWFMRYKRLVRVGRWISRKYRSF